MKELFEKLPRKSLEEVRGVLLLDTCFFIYAAEHHKLERIEDCPIATTSFNLEELEHVSHRLDDSTKVNLRKFFKHHPHLLIIDVPVHPGDKQGEHNFVEKMSPELIQLVPDPSDAVLAAAALQTKSDLLTKDKHHLFTTELENFFNAAGIKVWKELKDALVTLM